MRVVVQRVAHAKVKVSGEVVGSIEAGLCVLVGAVSDDVEADADFIARKLVTLRIFQDEEDRMNRSIQDIKGKLLLISQFTLAADTTSGTRPSFSNALPPNDAKPLIEYLVNCIESQGIQVETGVFGARMEVDLCNSGPVTIVLDSKCKVRK